MRILLAEDDFFSRKLMAAYLAPYGEVDIAVNGKEAIEAVKAELLENKHYDLICLDIMMPGLDGLQALKQIRLMEKERGFIKDASKIFMTTALSDKENVTSAALSGCDAYLIKPINKSKLIAELERCNLIPHENS